MAKEKMISIAVLGAGNMGTALAQILALRGREVRLWDYNPKMVEIIARKGVNDKFLPGVKLSRRIIAEVSMAQAVERAQLVIVACASPYVRETVWQLGHYLHFAPTPPNLPSGRGGKLVSPPLGGGVRGGAVVAHVAKGLEDKTFLTMHEVVQSELPSSLRRRVVTISGPSIAKEFLAGVPTAVVVASKDMTAAYLVQKVFTSSTFRVEISRDWKGVAVAGALKNVYAIALGMCDPVRARGRLGRPTSNGTAWMFTLALQEMRRVTVALGGKQETVYGLAGIGDLVVTGLGEGRNRALGERICKEGLPPARAGGAQAGHCKFVGEKNNGTVEGVTAARVFYKLCQRKKISAPMIKLVYDVLYKGADPCKEVKNFFARVKINDRQ